MMGGTCAQAVDDARRAAEELTACPPDEGHAETAAALARGAVAAARTLGERAARKMQRIVGIDPGSAAHSEVARVEAGAR